MVKETPARIGGDDGFEPPKYLANLIAAINDGAKAAQAGMLFFLLVGLYLLATAFSASDEDLLLGRTVTISQIGASLPVSFSFAIAPSVFVFLHVYALTRYDMLATNIRFFLAQLQTMVPFAADRERCRQLLANVEFVQALAAPRESTLNSRLWPALFLITMSAFPVIVLLLVQINTLRYQSDLINTVQRIWLLIDVSAIVAFFWRNPLSGRERLRDAPIAFNIYRGALIVLPGIIIGMNLAWLNVVPATADAKLVRFEGPFPFEGLFDLASTVSSQPLDSILCPSLNWGCRYLRVEHRTLVDHVWDNSAMAALRAVGGDYKKALAGIEGVVLRGRNLRFAVLDDSRLYAADLIGADLTKARLRSARLLSAKLASVFTNLQGADLSDADLADADFREANMAGSTLRGARLTGADLSDANLAGAELSGAQLPGVDLVRAKLEGADFSEAQLAGANLREAQLSDATLTGARMPGANLGDATMSRAFLFKTQLAGADLRGADLRGADLRGAQLAGADLRGGNLTGAALGLIGFSMTGPGSGDALFVGAFVLGADMAGADISDSNLLVAQLAGADLSAADLAGANLTGVQMAGVNLSGTRLTAADLHLARAWHAVSTERTALGLADLRDCDFRTPPTESERSIWVQAVNAIPDPDTKRAATARLDRALATDEAPTTLRFAASPAQRVLVSDAITDAVKAAPQEWTLVEPPQGTDWVMTDASRAYLDALAGFLVNDLARADRIIGRGIIGRVYGTLKLDPADLPARGVACRLLREVKAKRVEMDPRWSTGLATLLQDEKVDCTTLDASISGNTPMPR